jgi:hypothetical protein
VTIAGRLQKFGKSLQNLWKTRFRPFPGLAEIKNPCVFNVSFSWPPNFQKCIFGRIGENQSLAVEKVWKLRFFDRERFFGPGSPCAWESENHLTTNPSFRKCFACSPGRGARDQGNLLLDPRSLIRALKMSRRVRVRHGMACG